MNEPAKKTAPTTTAAAATTGEPAKSKEARYYVVTDKSGKAVVAKAISEQQARAKVADIEQYTVRLAKNDDLIGVSRDQILDATAKAAK